MGRKAENICFPLLLPWSIFLEAVSKVAVQFLIIYNNKHLEFFFNFLEYLNEIQL